MYCGRWYCTREGVHLDAHKRRTTQPSRRPCNYTASIVRSRKQDRCPDLLIIQIHNSIAHGERTAFVQPRKSCAQHVLTSLRLRGPLSVQPLFPSIRPSDRGPFLKIPPLQVDLQVKLRAYALLDEPLQHILERSHERYAQAPIAIGFNLVVVHAETEGESLYRWEVGWSTHEREQSFAYMFDHWAMAHVVCERVKSEPELLELAAKPEFCNDD